MLKKIGPYLLKETLGRGGMGVVYRALHQKTGNFVALKTVHLIAKDVLQGIRREIKGLLRLEHPGIVRIIDEGIHNGLPWYAMDLIQGTSLREYIQLKNQGISINDGTTRDSDIIESQIKTASYNDSLYSEMISSKEKEDDNSLMNNISSQKQRMAMMTIKREEILHRLQIMYRLCFSLSYLHGEGIIHKDLKPGNIILKDDNMPVVVDFGLIHQFSGTISREILTVIPRRSGTISYMSPEQLRGEELDARSDIYSFGCILYELITGTPVFPRETVNQIVEAHMYSSPLRPSTIIPDFPTDLEDLLLSMLEKSPQDRIGYVDDVAVQLENFGVDTTLPYKPPSSRTYLYRPGFIGRDTQLQSLDRMLVDLERERGGFVFIGGESGIGKTRVALEFARKAQRKGIITITGDCSEAGRQAFQPFRKIFQFVADQCREEGPQEIKRLFDIHIKILIPFEPSFGQLPGIEDFPTPVELPHQEATSRLFFIMNNMFRALCKNRALLLILDDLQWADALTIEYLSFLVSDNNWAYEKFLFMGTYRTDEASEDLKKLTLINTVQSIVLDRFNSSAIEHMVSDMLALTSAPVNFCDYIKRHTEGNPFFVAEYLQAAVEEGLLFRDQQGYWNVPDRSVNASKGDIYDLNLPKSLEDLINRRLIKLPKIYLDIVHVACILGREFDRNLLNKIVDLPEDELFVILNEIITRQIFEELFFDNIRFIHNKIREVAYSQLNPEKRLKLHLKAAEVIEQLPEENMEKYYGQLGEHWELGGNIKKAREWYLKSGRFEFDRNAYEDAYSHYQSYFRLIDSEDEETLAVRFEFADTILNMSGRYEEAINSLLLILGSLNSQDNKGLQFKCLNGLASFYVQTGEYSNANEICQQMMNFVHTLNDPEMLATLYFRQSSLAYMKGNTKEALNLINKGLIELESVPLSTLKGSLLSMQGTAYRDLKRYQAAEASYEEAQKCHQVTGDKFSEGITMMNLAGLYNHQSKYNEAEKLLLKTLQLFKQIGSRHYEGFTRHDLGVHYSYSKQFDLAMEYYKQALDIFKSIGDRGIEGLTYCGMGVLEYDQSHIEKAREYLTLGTMILREVGGKGWEIQYSLKLAMIERLEGNFKQTEDVLELLISELHETEQYNTWIVALCEQGHLTIARKQSAEAYIKKIHDILSRMNEQELAGNIEKIKGLKAAQEIWKSGQLEKLYRGAVIDLLPEHVRKYYLG